jgi:hypothetical protein
VCECVCVIHTRTPLALSSPSPFVQLLTFSCVAAVAVSKAPPAFVFVYSKTYSICFNSELIFSLSLLELLLPLFQTFQRVCVCVCACVCA